MAVNASGNSDDLKAEINVTPLVDVVLVLLIIFMVVTPLLKQEVPIELPIADNSRSAEEASQVTLSLAADGRKLLNGVEVPEGELVARLTAMYADRPDKTIFLEADRGLSHGRVVDLMDDCRAAGIARIGIITKKEVPAAAALGALPAASAVPASDPSAPPGG
jgi:biopolymer transport protein ExbD